MLKLQIFVLNLIYTINMEIQIIDHKLKELWEEKPELFKPQTEGSGGIDMFACMPEVVQIAPGEVKKIGTGIKTAIPKNWVGLLVPRSGLGTKGLIIAHTVGVIDSDYRGEIKLPLMNRNLTLPLNIKPYERVAQLVIIPHIDYDRLFVSTDELDVTERGEGGFNSTGS